MGKRMAARLFDTEAVNHLDVILAKLNALDNRNSAHSRDKYLKLAVCNISMALIMH